MASEGKKQSTCMEEIKADKQRYKSIRNCGSIQSWSLNHLGSKFDAFVVYKKCSCYFCSMTGKPYLCSSCANPPNPDKVRWHDTNVMFTDSRSMKELGFPRSENYEDTASTVSLSTGPKATFCYICSTLEEHTRHLLQNRPKRPVTAKPRIEYVAPKPRIRKKMIEEAPNVGDHSYRVDVFTGDMVNAGTSGEVFITIKGSRDILYRTKLGKKTANFCFMRNTKESFFVKSPRLGNLEIITIEHDSGKRNQKWYLEKIEITDMKTGDIWVFMCKEWLFSPDSKDLIGKEKERPVLDYDITVYTGTKSFAGTDANISLTIYGARGQSQKILLKDTSKGKTSFERGSVDKFRVPQKDMGELKKIRIEHDGKGMAAGWLLDKVTIQTHDPKQMYYFLFGGWIGKDAGKGLLYRDIFAKKSLPKEVLEGPKTTYVVTVRTGDKRYAGTDANVYIQICGKNNKSTRKIALDDSKNNFERDMVDQFKLEAPDVGPISHIIIGHDDFGPGAGWFLDEVSIKRYIQKKEATEYVKKEQKQKEKRDLVRGSSGEKIPSHRKKYAESEDSDDERGKDIKRPLYEECVFPCYKWLASDEDDTLVERELKAVRSDLRFSENYQEEKVRYTVIVHTGNVKYAGTDANVFIQMIGENGQTTKRTQIDDEKNNFEKGMEDVFELEDVNVGSISHVVIGHDDSGPGSGWFLDKVLVRKYLTQKEIAKYMKEGKRKSKGKAKEKRRQSKGRRGLDSDDETDSEEDIRKRKSKDQAEERKKQRRGRRGIESEEESDSEEEEIKTPEYEEFVFPCNKWLDSKEDDRKTERKLKCQKKKIYFKGGNSQDSQTVYQVIVKTGTKNFAGTDANVYIQIFGKSELSTPKLQLDNEKNNFEKGMVDVFKLETTDVGPLTNVTVGHDDSGPGAGWYLDEIRVRRYIREREAKEYTKKGKKKPLYEESVFPCNRWLSKSDDDKKTERQLKCVERTLHYN